MKALVIGGNPAGMSAASRMKRKAPDTEVIVLEKSHEVSYGACGLPYYVAGLNDDLDRIRIRKAPEFEKNGISVGLGQEVIAVDTEKKIVTAKNEQGEESTYNYDKLLIASGTSPKVPPIPESDRIYFLPEDTSGCRSYQNCNSEKQGKCSYRRWRIHRT